MDIFILVLLAVVCAMLIGITYRKRIGNGGRASLERAMPSEPTTFARALWSNGHAHGDIFMSRSAAVELNGIFDADLVGKFDRERDHNLRETMSVEEVERLYQERRLRRCGLGCAPPRVSHAMAQRRKSCLRAVHLGERFVPHHRCRSRTSKE